MKRKDNDLKIISAFKRRLKYRLRKRVRNFPHFQLTTPTFIIRQTFKLYLTKFLTLSSPSNESGVANEFQSGEYEEDVNDVIDMDPVIELDPWIPFYPSPIDEESNVRIMTPKRARDKVWFSFFNIHHMSLYYLPELSSLKSPINPGIFFFLEDNDTIAIEFSDTFVQKTIS